MKSAVEEISKATPDLRWERVGQRRARGPRRSRPGPGPRPRGAAARGRELIRAGSRTQSLCHASPISGEAVSATRLSCEGFCGMLKGLGRPSVSKV